jgi:hypothetical protein
MVNAICQTRGAPLRTTTSMFSLFILGLFQLLTNSLTIMHVVTQYTAFSSAGFPKPLGTGPVRPVTGGTGPTWYTNRPGSHPKPCLSFLTPLNRPVSPVYRPVFLFVGTGVPPVWGTLLECAICEVLRCLSILTINRILFF